MRHMHIRRFATGDEPALFAVYFSAIHDIASRDYSGGTDQRMGADRPGLRRLYETFGFRLHSCVQKGSTSFARYELRVG